MSTDTSSAGRLTTIFLYTEEQRGNRLVESPVIGTISDFSNSERYVVVQDPHNNLQFAYAIQHDSNNLDATAIVELPPSMFDGKSSTMINGNKYKLGSPDTAMKFLRNKTQWIQDKGCMLSVLLQNAAAKRTAFFPRTIQRDRLTAIPAGVPVEHLPASFIVGPGPAPSAAAPTSPAVI